MGDGEEGLHNMGDEILHQTASQPRKITSWMRRVRG